MLCGNIVARMRYMEILSLEGRFLSICMVPVLKGTFTQKNPAQNMQTASIVVVSFIYCGILVCRNDVTTIISCIEVMQIMYASSSEVTLKSHPELSINLQEDEKSKLIQTKC